MPRETELNLDECENEIERMTAITKEAVKECSREIEGCEKNRCACGFQTNKDSLIYSLKMWCSFVLFSTGHGL